MNAKADPENFKESMQYLEFKLSNDLYAINILSIKEIIDHRSMMPLPMTPNFLAGVINLRGSVVPVIELARRFDKEPAEKTNRSSILIVEVEDHQEKIELGITVDVVCQVRDILISEIEPCPAFGTKIRKEFIEGIGKVSNKLLVLLDTQSILSIDELSAAIGE